MVPFICENTSWKYDFVAIINGSVVYFGIANLASFSRAYYFSVIENNRMHWSGWSGIEIRSSAMKGDVIVLGVLVTCIVSVVEFKSEHFRRSINFQGMRLKKFRKGGNDLKVQ